MPERTPSYRLHKPTGQAVVTLSGKDCYLGKHGTAESRAAYDRLLAEWLANGRRLPSASGPKADLTIDELIVAYLDHAETYYRRDGEPTGEATSIRYSLRTLQRLYGTIEARDFGPLALKAVRQAMIAEGSCRNTVNVRISRIVRMFRWAVEDELVPATVHHALKAVPGLRKGRTEARETDDVGTVPEAHIDAVRPLVRPAIRAMIDVQRLTAMRPGEVTILRACDLDRAGEVWTYVPSKQKTEHHGKSRTVYLGPKAQGVIRPWLSPDSTAYLFRPVAAIPHRHYAEDSYRGAIVRACKRAGVPAWHPNQLRHNAATMIRKEFGLDVARAILGHSSPSVTEVYAEVDRDKAIEVMKRIG